MRRVLIGGAASVALLVVGYAVQTVTPHVNHSVLAVASPTPTPGPQVSPIPFGSPTPVASPAPDPSPTATSSAALPPSSAAAGSTFPCVVTENGQLVVATCTGSHAP